MQEQKVLELSMRGLGDKQIATEMNLSLTTVRTYWKRIQAKVGGRTRAEIVAIVAKSAPDGEMARLTAEVQALENEINHLYTIYDFLPVAMMVMEPDGSCAFVNAAWERMTGREREEAIGSGWLSCVHPSDRAWKERRWKLRLIGEDPEEGDFRMLGPNGVIPVRTMVNRMVEDEKCVGFVSVIQPSPSFATSQ